MQLSAVLLARIFFFLETNDLNPRGKAFFPDVIRALVERYRFQKFPQRFEDLDESKGVEFASGRSGATTIDKAVLYAEGISLDTRESTQRSAEVLEEILTWASEHYGLQYRKETVRRKAYVSQVTFVSEGPLLFVNPILKDFGDRISDIVSQNLRLECKYAPSALLISLDPESQRFPSGPLSIEHRMGTPFSEGKYFSSAPVQTDLHLKLLEEFERRMRDEAVLRRPQTPAIR